jgi:hypothetical protein
VIDIVNAADRRFVVLPNDGLSSTFAWLGRPPEQGLQTLTASERDLHRHDQPHASPLQSDNMASHTF